MHHMKQPSAKSCGATCVAMVANVDDVYEVIRRLHKLRNLSRAERLGFTNHSANVGEMQSLFAGYGWHMGPRRQGVPPPRVVQFALLRIPHAKGQNWHWAVLQCDRVYDPDGSLYNAVYPSTNLPEGTSHYPLTRVER